VSRILALLLLGCLVWSGAPEQGPKPRADWTGIKDSMSWVGHWDLKTGRCVKAQDLQARSSAGPLEWVVDSQHQRVACVSRDTAWIYSPGSPPQCLPLSEGLEYWPGTSRFSNDDGRFTSVGASLHTDMDLLTWDTHPLRMETRTLGRFPNPTMLAPMEGGRLATIPSGTRDIYEWHANSDKPAKLLTTLKADLGILYRLTSSPDGRWLVVQGQRGVSLIENTTGIVAWSNLLPTIPYARPVISRTSKYILLISSEEPASSSLAIYECKTGERLSFPLVSFRESSLVAVSGDERFIATFDEDHGQIVVWNLATRKKVRSIPLFRGSEGDLGNSIPVAITFSPDGKQLLVAFINPQC